MNKSNLKIAISQFPVSTDIQRNYVYIYKHTILASKRKAHVVHFPELSLSGYDTEINKLDWNQIELNIKKLQDLAKLNTINIVVGVHSPNKKNRLPYNSTILITSEGIIGGKYIKTKLYSKENKRFSSIRNFFTYDINNIKCGFLICYDSSFPELFQQYRKLGVKLLFLSYHNAKSSKSKNSMDELMRSQLITRSSDNLMYISGSNSSSRYSRMPSSFAYPDGTLISIKRHSAGIIVCDYPKIDLGWTYDNSK